MSTIAPLEGVRPGLGEPEVPPNLPPSRIGWAQVFIDHRVPAVGYVVEDSLAGTPALKVLRYDIRGAKRPELWVPITNVRSIEVLHWSQVVNMCGKVEVSMEEIVRAVSDEMGVSVHAMRGSSKKEKVSTARMAAMVLATRLTSMTQQAISSRFGRRDHGSVIWAIQSIEAREETQPAFQKMMGNLHKRLVEESPIAP